MPGCAGAASRTSVQWSFPAGTGPGPAARPLLAKIYELCSSRPGLAATGPGSRARAVPRRARPSRSRGPRAGGRRLVVVQLAALPFPGVQPGARRCRPGCGAGHPGRPGDGGQEGGSVSAVAGPSGLVHGRLMRVRGQDKSSGAPASLPSAEKGESGGSGGAGQRDAAGRAALQAIEPCFSEQGQEQGPNPARRSVETTQSLIEILASPPPAGRLNGCGTWRARCRAFRSMVDFRG